MGNQNSIYGGYRNEAFYENFYKDKTAEQAYRETVLYLAKPTFKFEKDCAMKVYEAKYGEFKSAETKKIDDQAVEIERLKAIIAAAPPPAPVAPPEPPSDPLPSESPPPPLDFKDFPRGMDKDTFKCFFFPWFQQSQCIVPSNVHYGKAWKEYQKNGEENE
jgi:hypothetical protein